MNLRMVIAFTTLLSCTGLAHAEGCNIADLLFGSVRIEIIPHNTDAGKYETGIIFGNDANGGNFSSYKILGQIDPSQRDGSWPIMDVNGELCGNLQSNLRIDTEYASCVGTWCKIPMSLRRVTTSTFVVLSNGSIKGTVEGHFPK